MLPVSASAWASANRNKPLCRRYVPQAQQDAAVFEGLPVITGLYGFTGKPVVDIRNVPLNLIEKLSRAQMRDMLFTVGKERPSWDTQLLKTQVYSIVSSMQRGDEDQLQLLEEKFGLQIPAKGEDFDPKVLRAIRERSTNAAPTKRKYTGREKKLCDYCGQGVRSSCFYRCCKNCCMQMKNPCHPSFQTQD